MMAESLHVLAMKFFTAKKKPISNANPDDVQNPHGKHCRA
jgi:hypothetical protein